MSGGGTVAIVGVSSELGLHLASLLADDGVAVVGSFRRWQAGLDRLTRLFRQRGVPLELHRLDVREVAALTAFVDTLAASAAERGSSLALTYLCGQWAHGPLSSHPPAAIDAMLEVGLRAPCLLAARLLARWQGVARVVLVTSLGGEKSSIAHNSLAAVCANGLYSLTRSLGMELAGCGSSCVTLALGFFDKGQPYIDDIAPYLSIGRPPSIARAAETLRYLLLEADPLLNGSVIELAGGLFNYRDVIDFLRRRQDPGDTLESGDGG